MRLSDNYLMATMDFGDTSFQLTGGPALNDNKWHHLVIVRNSGTKFYWYVDGKNVAETTRTEATNFDVSSDVFIGKHPTSADQFFSGLIDDARVYNRALSSMEIERMYTESVSRFLAQGENASN